MRKVKFQLPNPPTRPIVVLDSYDSYFREGLLRAIRADFEAFSEGLPTYHKQILAVVNDYAGAVVNAESLGLKDLENFLRGMRSHTPRIAVLDAYVQLVDPNARKRFFVDSFIDNVGSVIGDYLEAPSMDGYDRSVVTERLAGAYELKVPPMRGEDASKQPPRYLVLRRSSSGAYLLCYEFNSYLRTSLHEQRDEQLRLVTGVCVPQPRRCFLLMRDFRYQQRRVGTLVRYPRGELDRLQRTEPEQLMVFTFASADSTPWNAYIHKLWMLSPHDRSQMDMDTFGGSKITDETKLGRINRIIDSFGDVF